MINVTLRLGAPTGALLADLTAFATSCKWSHNLHGASAFEMVTTAPLWAWGKLAAYNGLVFVVVSNGCQNIWVGRMQAPDANTDQNGTAITIRAYGLWQALDDITYTALWSSTSVADWRAVTAQDVASRTPERYIIDTNNRLFIGLKKNAQYTSSTRGALCFVAPDGGLRSILTFSADVEHNLPSGTWDIRLQRFDTGLGGTATTVTIINGTGGVATTTINQSWSGTCSAILIEVVYNSGVATTYTGEDGASYVRLTNILVKTATASTVTSNLIASHLAQLINGINSFISSTALITSASSYDLTDLTFEDARPTQILNEVAARGDGAGTIYTAGVTNNGQIYLWPVGTNGRAWYVDATSLQASSDRTKMANSVYAVYKDANGRKTRTAVATNAASISRYGYTRLAAVSSDTTSSTRAEEWRDTYLADNATAPGQASIAFDRVYASGGGLGQLSEVMPGDTIVIRNLPFISATGGDIDRIRSFRITETEYDAVNNVLTVTPETPLPRLDVLIAQGAI